VDYETFPLGGLERRGADRFRARTRPWSRPAPCPSTPACSRTSPEGVEASSRKRVGLLLDAADPGRPRAYRHAHCGGSTAVALQGSEVVGVRRQRHVADLVGRASKHLALRPTTAMVSLYKKLGVNIALGTDWLISGSMNILREAEVRRLLQQHLSPARLQPTRNCGALVTAVGGGRAPGFGEDRTPLDRQGSPT